MGRPLRKTTTLVIDGNVLLKRSYNGAKHVFYKDQHIGGLYQFYTTLRKLVVELKINKIIIMWDGERGGTLRLDYYPEYKGNRAKFFDESLERQKVRVQMYAEDLYIRQYIHPDCESDDLMAYYALNKKKNEEIIIYTNDRDLCQMISEEVSIYLADKKQLVGIGNYSWYFKHHYSNAGVVKIIEGCSSDYIKGIDLVTENTLLEHFPEIKERTVTVEEIREKAKEINGEREKPLKSLQNIIDGKSKGSHRGDFYEVNDKIINLKNPLLPDEVKEDVQTLIDLPLDPEGRDYKNVLKMMLEDGVMFNIPGGVDGYVKWMEPFMKLIKKEKVKFKKSKL
jgi:5'-3' exonuclease